MTAFATLLLLIGLAIAAVVGTAGLTVPPSAVAASMGISGEGGEQIVARFVTRSRRFRLIGAWLGLATFLVVSSAVSQEITQRTGEGDPGIQLPIAAALGFSLLGSVIAELHRTRQGNTVRTASLAVRDESAYGDPTAARRERWVLGFAAVLTLIGIAGAHTGVWLLGLGIGGLALVRRWAQSRIAARPRPAIDPALAEADDRIRRLAVSHGIARPAVAVMALLAAGQAGLLDAATTSGSGESSLLGIASFGLTLAGIVWWWRNRNFGVRPGPANRDWSLAGAAAAVSVAVLLLVLFLVAAR